MRAQFGNQHISLQANSLFMVRIRASERRRFAGWKSKFMRDRCKLSLSFPATRTLSCLPETFLARFPVSVKSFSRLRPTTEDVSAFGQHRKFPPHARKKNLVPRVLVLASRFACWSRVTSRDSPNKGELVRRLHELELISSKWF